jgi:hypothetical protein
MLIGEHIGEHLGHSVIGLAAAPVIGMATHARRQAGIQTVTDLTREAMLHPELARTLMQRADASKAVFKDASRRRCRGL